MSEVSICKNVNEYSECSHGTAIKNEDTPNFMELGIETLKAKNYLYVMFNHFSTTPNRCIKCSHGAIITKRKMPPVL